MKLHFGHGIAAFYLLFMIVLLTFVVKSTSHDNSLVLDNYYEQDLNYQQHYDKVNNARLVAKYITVTNSEDNGSVVIQFPKNNMVGISGKILLFNPASKALDIEKEITLNHAGMMTIPTANMRPGKWKVKLDWQQKGRAFYTEKEIYL